MNVQQLIEHLQQMPPEAQVVTSYTDIYDNIEPCHISDPELVKIREYKQKHTRPLGDRTWYTDELEYWDNDMHQPSDHTLMVHI